MTTLNYAGKPVHFPFIEGQFSARDCHACGELCCAHTDGLILAASQEALVLALGGPAAVISRDENAIYLDTTGGCPALRADGLCGLHVDGGPRAKPALCALFPYVALSDHGHFFSLAPNIAYVCPMSLERPAGPPRPSFTEILDDLQHFFPDGRAPCTPAPLHPLHPIDREEEARIVASAERLRGRADFLDVLREVRGAAPDPALLQFRDRTRRLAPAPGLDFYTRALPLTGILRSWLFTQPRDVVDRTTDLALRLLHRRLQHAARSPAPASAPAPTELQRMAHALQRDLGRCLQLAQLQP